MYRLNNSVVTPKEKNPPKCSFLALKHIEITIKRHFESLTVLYE